MTTTLIKKIKKFLKIKCKFNSKTKKIIKIKNKVLRKNTFKIMNNARLFLIFEK